MPKKNAAKTPERPILAASGAIYLALAISVGSLFMTDKFNSRKLLLSFTTVNENATYHSVPAAIDTFTGRFTTTTATSDTLKEPKWQPSSVFQSDSGSSDTQKGGTGNEALELQPLFDNVYWCGHGTLFDELDGVSFVDLLFPDSRVIHRDRLSNLLPLSNRNLTNGTGHSRDILLSTYGGNCMNNIVRMRDRSWKLPQIFSGQILYFNGEPKPGYATDHPRVFSVGTKADSEKTIQIYFASMYLNAMAMSTQLQIYDPKRKPVNTGKHFLIYAASHCIDYREEAFARFAAIGTVHYAGKCAGSAGSNNAATSTGNETHAHFNRTFRQPRDTMNGPSYLQNAALFHDYRFSLVLENSNMQGYLSEKIVNAFLSGSVPIFYGTPDVKKVFNERSFVYYDILDPQKAINRVKHLERNRTAYHEVMNEPILANGQDTINQYFSLQDQVGSGLLKQRIRAMVQVPKYTGGVVGY